MRHMQLKDYQNDVLDSLSRYLSTLLARQEEAGEYREFQRSRGRIVAPANYCLDAWHALHTEGRLPLVTDKLGNRVLPPCVDRQDGLGRPVPNICLKVPTGGGKTLLGTVAVERINIEYFKRQTGFVLWIVPSDAIYSQTWRAFANREHPYRQMLERASGGRVRLLEKGDPFTKQDVEQQLCVMLMMLQAGSVRRETKESRKMFQDSGRLPSFFPDVDDAPANETLMREVPNLDASDMMDEEFSIAGLSVKQSLSNVLKLVRPLVIIDEGHKAYSNIALDFIASHNPRFILELSATPNTGRDYVSNVLVNVSGQALKDEEMIKLPINLINESRADWTHALAAGQEKLDELQRDADKVRNNEGRYIRPILLIRVERTGKEQRDKAMIHAEDVREFLLGKLGAHPDEIKVKSAELDELAGVDLLSDLCPVRYVITKDALREGWDCPFAYVLAVLAKTTARTTLTQMIGRVLRQPEARLTGISSLNECYVFTFDQEVQAAVDSVRKGLQEEGMGDLVSQVWFATEAGAAIKQTIHCRKDFEGLSVFLPRVLSRHYASGVWRVFDYDRDLLSRLDWSAFRYSGQLTPDEIESLERTHVRVDLPDLTDKAAALVGAQVTTDSAELSVEVPSLVRLLLDVIPNPWQGARIVNEALFELRKQGYSEERIFTNRLFLVKAIRENLREQVNNAAEQEFRQMLHKNEISFQLQVSHDPYINWELRQTFESDVSENDQVLLPRNGEALERSLFRPVYQKQVNGLEKEVAWYLDSNKAVRWWHRIAVSQQDWHLQGWQRPRVYPDFLACLHDAGDGKLRFTVLETKGLHLAGNEDTTYKARLFELLTTHSQTASHVGELKLGLEHQVMRFELLLENDWREKLPVSLSYV